MAIGYRAPEVAQSASESDTVYNAAPLAMVQPTVNDVVAADIAASVAQVADLAIAGAANELAVSTRVKFDYSSSDDSGGVAKPTIIALSAASRKIVTYTVLPGDNVQRVAAKFGLSVDTIKWANDLVGDNLSEGKVLDILPRNGIAYTVKDGDTIKKLAEKYKTDASLITTYNDLEISGLSRGLKIIIPNGQLPTNERPGYASPISYSSFVVGYGTWSGQVLSQRYVYTPSAGGYADGNCTAYAYVRRAQLGRPIPTNLGNAYTWATVAARSGYIVNSTPAAGAVIQAGNHVGVVEEVLSNGDLRITDMNYGYRPHNLAERIIPASTVHNYKFIH